MNAQIAVIDYGSQYTQLIVRRFRELGYFAKLYLPAALHEIGQPAGVVLSGGPRSVSEEGAPDVDFAFLEGLGVPVLGICYGMQLLNRKLGGVVTPGYVREYGPSLLVIESTDTLMAGVKDRTTIWMSHSDTCTQLPQSCRVLARNQDGHAVALQWSPLLFGIQFHPEVTHTDEGLVVLQNFAAMIGEPPKFSMEQFKREMLERLAEQTRGKRVVCGVSGGVDSTVLAKLLHDAGVELHPILVDHGLLRKDEAAEVRRQFDELNIPIEVVDASDRFLGALEGVTDPEQKRRIIGNLFLDVFFESAGRIDLFAQGTLYPDVIESATSGSEASKIKTHHNRVDRVLELQREGRVIEPLAELFKDEVRALGATLGISHDTLFRHPFPGPGLAVRMPGEITREKLAILREADAIYTSILKRTGWYEHIWQACTTLLSCKTVGVKGDERAYEYPISLRAVISTDAMTADWVELPHTVLREISNTILNRVKGINRVLFDISTKPPASIEWE